MQIYNSASFETPFDRFLKSVINQWRYIKIRNSMNFIYKGCFKYSTYYWTPIYVFGACSEIISNIICKNLIWKILIWYSLICFLSLILSSILNSLTYLFYGFLYYCFSSGASFILYCLEKNIVTKVFLSIKDLMYALTWGRLLGQAVCFVMHHHTPTHTIGKGLILKHVYL